jgi:ribosomal protein S18 acetylase RimI-like enzyme
MEMPVQRENPQIRLATWDDLPALLSLDWSVHPSGTFADRLMYQDAGHMEFLLAVLSGGIVGQLLLKWDGPEDPVLRLHLPACAEIEDFVVAPDVRGMGIGGAMLDTAARHAAEHGSSRLGLAVVVDNGGARALYERHGFREMPRSAHEVTWLMLDDDGSSHLERATCVYMMKEVQ